MRTICRDIGFPRPNFVDVFSSCFLLQGSLLPVVAHELISDEYRVFCAHDFPSYAFPRWNYTLRDILPV
jgi:hypothetical protein